MRAHSMNIQFTNGSRHSHQLKQQGIRYIQEERPQNNLNISKNANSIKTENQYSEYSFNLSQGVVGLKNRTTSINTNNNNNNINNYSNNKYLLNKQNKNSVIVEQDLSGQFIPVLLENNKKNFQKQIEVMQNSTNIFVNRNNYSNNKNSNLPADPFYSTQNQLPTPQQQKQSQNNYLKISSDQKNSSSFSYNDNGQHHSRHQAADISDVNYKRLRDVIKNEQVNVNNNYGQKQQFNLQLKQQEFFPSPTSSYSTNCEGLPINQIQIFPKNNIEDKHIIEDDEEQEDYLQLRQIESTQPEQCVKFKEDNLVRQSSLELVESRAAANKRSLTSQNNAHSQSKSKVAYNITATSLGNNNLNTKSSNHSQSINQRQANSPVNVSSKNFLSPQKISGSNTNIPNQYTSNNSSTIVRRSYSAVKNTTMMKKEDMNKTKKVTANPNDLMILKIKEQMTNKKYNDPIGIKKQKAKQKLQNEIKQSRKMYSTSTSTYNPKIKEEAQVRIRSLKDSMSPYYNKNNSNVQGEGKEEDDDDDDSMVMSNDISLDLDDDEEDINKQNAFSPLGVVSTTDSIPNNKQRVLLLKSVFQGRPSTIFFPYHKSCQQPERDASRTVAISEFETKKFNLKFKINGENPYKCVVKAFEEAGFEHTDDHDWNAVWSLPKKDRVKNMNSFQRFNHFPGCWNLGRKDAMYKCLNRIKRKNPKEVEFVPNTYLLCNSGDWDRFLAKREEASKNQLWILKPADQACGRGVKVISKTTKVKRKSNRIICDYIANPHLINGLKYDLRLYVLVTSYDPLRIYLFQEGLTRFATEKYTTNTKEVSKRYVHLTNYSVNKFAKKFVKNTGSETDGEGSKWSLSALKAKYKEMGINVEELFDKIKDIIIKTCISAEPHMLDLVAKSTEHRTNCFELYGFDILIDSALKPWILEVNVCPSLSSSSPLDRKIKHSLLVDVLNIIGITPYDKKQYTEDKKNNMFTRAFSSAASIVLDSENDKNSKINNVKKTFSKNINDIQDLNVDNCLEKLSPENWEVLFETDEENYRRGHFERIYPIPSKEKLEYYSQFYDFQRFNNIMVQKWITSNSNFLEKILKKRYHNSV